MLWLGRTNGCGSWLPEDKKKADMCHGRQTVVAHGHLMARSASKQASRNYRKEN